MWGRGDVVIWSLWLQCKELLKMLLTKIGGPLSEKNLCGGPYWEIKFCSFWMMESADLEDVWYTKGIFTESVCNEEIFFAVVGEEVSCQALPGGESGTSLRSRGWTACLALYWSADLAMINIIANVMCLFQASRWWLGTGVLSSLCLCDCCEGHWAFIPYSSGGNTHPVSF